MKIVWFQNHEMCMRGRVWNSIKFRLELAKRKVWPSESSQVFPVVP